jgi:hypothetical protein
MSSMSLGSTRRGATLPLTVIVLAVLAVGLAMTYSRISTERVINSDIQAQQGAFAVAQSGLNRYMSTLNAKPATAGPWPITVNYNNLPQGTAQVVMQQLRDSTTTLLPAIYIITSRGRYTAARRYNSRIPSAERTVATYAIWQPAPFDLNGAFTSLNGAAYNGSSAHISGIDHCAAGASNIPGLAVPNGDVSGFTQSPPTLIDGTPDNAASNLGTPGPTGTAKAQVQMDWAGIVAGTAFPPDYVYPTWPTTTQFNSWPVTRVNGDLTMPSSGNGILIVTGNLTWNGTPLKTWNGIILVGGSITANGAANVYGAVVTGLNVKTGGTPGVSDLGNGTKTYQYDSCALTRALGHIGSMQRLRNAWTDTWSSY